MSDTRAAALRQARIVKAIEDHAHRFHQVCPGSEARYVLETWVKDATTEERDFAYGYVRSHPELFTIMPRLTEAEVAARDVDNAHWCDEQAAAALRDGEFELALYLLDAAEWWVPGSVPWLDRKRDIIRIAMEA